MGAPERLDGVVAVLRRRWVALAEVLAGEVRALVVLSPRAGRALLLVPGRRKLAAVVALRAEGRRACEGAEALSSEREAKAECVTAAAAVRLLYGWSCLSCSSFGS